MSDHYKGYPAGVDPPAAGISAERAGEVFWRSQYFAALDAVRAANRGIARLQRRLEAHKRREEDSVQRLVRFQEMLEMEARDCFREQIPEANGHEGRL